MDPPHIIRAMPERKRFFAVDVFPKTGSFGRGQDLSGMKRRQLQRLVVANRTV